MKLWISQDDKFKLGDFYKLEPDFRNVTATISFSEMRFQRDGNDYIIYMVLAGGKELSDKVDFTKLPMPYVLRVHEPGTSYELYDLDKKGKVSIETPDQEKVIWHALELLDPTKAYVGTLSISNSDINSQILKALALLAQLSPFNVTELPTTPTLDKLKLDVPAASSAAGGKYSSKPAQTEAGKLEDRLKFLLLVGNQVLGTDTIKTLEEFYNSYHGLPEQREFVFRVVDTLVV